MSILVFSGYTLDEIQKKIPEGPAILGLIDILVAGRYRSEHRRTKLFLSSSNQQVFFLTDRYVARDLSAVPDVEAFIDPAGRVIVTGMGFCQPASQYCGLYVRPRPNLLSIGLQSSGG